MEVMTGPKGIGETKQAELLSSTTRHDEESRLIPASAKQVFDYLDDHSRLSSHMSQSSWMMGGGRMHIQVDAGRGQFVGSHIRLSGKVLGINLFLDEVVTQHEPPYRKAWQTVGALRLLVIGHYRMGLEVKPQNGGSNLRAFIDYELPTTLSTRWLGYLFGGIYARWCIRQMIQGAREHFSP